MLGIYKMGWGARFLKGLSGHLSFSFPFPCGTLGRRGGGRTYIFSVNFLYLQLGGGERGGCVRAPWVCSRVIHTVVIR